MLRINLVLLNRKDKCLRCIGYWLTRMLSLFFIFIRKDRPVAVRGVAMFLLSA